MNYDLIYTKDAAEWASNYLDKNVTKSNITYLIQYGKIKKYQDNNNKILIDKNELKNYYEEKIKNELKWKDSLGDDLNWDLSFDQYREADTTKHVHRLHPYKGKFIPQLVEYFLDNHTDQFKEASYFKKEDIIIDPFMGSGTTLVQSAEMGYHSIGIDVSEFNCMIAAAKLADTNILILDSKLKGALNKTIQFSKNNFDDDYEAELKKRMSNFNRAYFPSPEYKWRIAGKADEEKLYGESKASEFLKLNQDLFKENGTKLDSHLIENSEISSFLDKWYNKRIRQEMAYYIKLIHEENEQTTKTLMQIILSRTARSCRATTHYDLATLRDKVEGPYYCYKHKKICTPINSILKHLKKTTEDTISRLTEFSNLRQDVFSSIIHGDSRNVDIFNEIKKQNPKFYSILKNKKIDGVFTSPPYVGQIDYHEQHAYSYELFEIERHDDKEIGPLSKGKGVKAKEDYKTGISQVLKNVCKYTKDDGNLFIVANDKFGLYPEIAEISDLKIIKEYKRPVLNRTERDRQPYAEIIFHMIKK